MKNFFKLFFVFFIVVSFEFVSAQECPTGDPNCKPVDSSKTQAGTLMLGSSFDKQCEVCRGAENMNNTLLSDPAKTVSSGGSSNTITTTPSNENSGR